MTSPPRVPTQAMLAAATLDRLPHGLDQDIRTNIWCAMWDAWEKEQTSRPGNTQVPSEAGRSATKAPSTDTVTDSGPHKDACAGRLDHQSEGRDMMASVRCSSGASPLESGNAREATCLTPDDPARDTSATQQGQLGANAGSNPAPPTGPIADLCARLRDELSGERDRHKRTHERAKRAEAERDKKADYAERMDALAEERLTRAERAESERDTLRAIVRAADAAIASCTALSGSSVLWDAYDRARAQWKGES